MNQLRIRPITIWWWSMAGKNCGSVPSRWWWRTDGCTSSEDEQSSKCWLYTVYYFDGKLLFGNNFNVAVRPNNQVRNVQNQFQTIENNPHSWKMVLPKMYTYRHTITSTSFICRGIFKVGFTLNLNSQVGIYTLWYMWLSVRYGFEKGTRRSRNSLFCFSVCRLYFVNNIHTYISNEFH